jgi:Zn2+/Cd2+-exporting ATPase
VALFGIAFGLPTIFLKAVRTLRQCRFDINCLMLFASLGAVALQDYTEAAAVVFLFALSEWLEIRATFRARNALAEIVNLRPEQAVVFHPTTQELMVMPAAAVPVGVLVSVKTGDKIPCDGVVVEGTSTVDESSLTGESRPIRKGPSDAVAGGTINCGHSPLTIRTTATSENSAVARLIRLVEDAQANRSETEQLVDRLAQVYTPIVVLAGLLMCTIPWIFGPDTGKEWTNNGLILIVIACPCSLIISTPVTYVAGLAATARRGVLVKGGATLEALSSIRHVCFDKTGTLTNAEFALLQLKLLSSEISREQVWQYLSLMEERASHPLALAILTAAKNEQTVVPKDMILEDHVMINGEGVSGLISGRKVYVGNEKMFTRLQMLEYLSPSDLAEVEEWKAFGGTIGFMSVDGYGIVCAYCVADRVRSEATKVIASLRKQKIRMTMLTGDNSETANAVGKLVGLRPEEIRSKLLPEEKLEYVQQLVQNKTTRSILSNGCRSQPLVMMCGDGVNDAPALACEFIVVDIGNYPRTFSLTYLYFYRCQCWRSHGRGCRLVHGNIRCHFVGFEFGEN